MKKLLCLTVIMVHSFCKAQNVDLSQFTLSNPSSPAFVLVEETPTAIYTPDNFKALALHALDNFGESFSIEATPYFLINQKVRSGEDVVQKPCRRCRAILHPPGERNLRR